MKVYIADITYTWLIIAYHISFKYVGTTRFERCGTDLQLLWQRDLGPAPFAACPLITDLDSDGHLDVVAALFSGHVYALHGDNGQLLTSGRWPYHVSHSSFHASPIQHDVDRDGLLDVLMCTSLGQVVTLTAEGKPITGKQYQLPDVYIVKDWFDKIITAERAQIHTYMLDGLPSDDMTEAYVRVPPHVLATPTLADLDEDGVTDDLIIAVSYYLDQYHYDLAENKTGFPAVSDLDKYLVSALVIFNLTSMTPVRTIHIDLTKLNAEYPGYVLSSAVVTQLDSGPLDIVLTTAAGQLHVVDMDGRTHNGFPAHMDSIHGQVAIDDVTGDDQFEIIVVDRSGIVACYSAQGDSIWETQLSDAPTSGVKLVDLDLDNRLDVLVGCVDGKVWVLHGSSGDVMTGWPVKVAHSMLSPVMVLHMEHSRHIPTVVSLGGDKHLHMLTPGDKPCRHVVGVGKQSFVSILTHDLAPIERGLELLVATQDGSLLCFSQVFTLDERGLNSETELAPELYAWPSETLTHGMTYYNGKRGVMLERPVSGSVASYSDSDILIRFYIYDTANTSYNISVSLGGQVLSQTSTDHSGPHSLPVISPRSPFCGQLCVHIINKHTQMYTSCMAVRFHETILSDLQWLLAAPSLFLALLLLFLHGFPKADLLPVSIPAKDR